MIVKHEAAVPHESSSRFHKIFLQDCKFIIGATKPADIPSVDVPEMAFVGKSNVGKSSLINFITNRKTLARTSNTPGRTRQINFFMLAEKLCLVDLPGYGYAQVSKDTHKDWEKLILKYLSNRPNLVLVCLLIDARRGIKNHDQMVIKLLADFNISFIIIFTKSDKITLKNHNDLIEHAAKFVENLHNFRQFIFTSARRNDGAEELRVSLGKYLSE